MSDKRVPSLRRFLLPVAVLVLVVSSILLIKSRMHKHNNATTKHNDYLKPLPLEGKLELVRELKKETVMESVAKLPEFNDTLWTLGSLGDDINRQGSYRFSCIYTPRLSRVRKILSEVAPDNRQQVVTELRRLLVSSTADYDAVYAKSKALVANSKTGVTLTEPDDNYRRLVIAPACAYLLTELRDHEILPALINIYYAEGRVPISRVFLFYTMHLLIIDHPRSGISPEAVRALDEYKLVAKDVPSPVTARVPSWDAKFDESDFRVQIVGNPNVDLASQPSIELRLYPLAVEQYESEGKQDKEIDKLAEKMRAVINKIYSR